jgi:hypothetical protein
VKRLQAKAREAFQQQRLGIKQAPSTDPPDLPGIIGAAAVVTNGSRSSDGSPAALTSTPPSESPPSLGHYDDYPTSSLGDRTSPQYETKPIVEDYWYSQAQHSGTLLRGNPMEAASQYGSYGSYAPEIYDPSAQSMPLGPSVQPTVQIPSSTPGLSPQSVQKVSPQTTQMSELYGWPQDDGRTVTILPATTPYHNHESSPAGPYSNANGNSHLPYQSGYANAYHSYYSAPAHNQSQAPNHNHNHVHVNHGHGHGHTHSQSQMHNYTPPSAHGHHGHGHNHSHSHSHSQSHSMSHAQPHGHHQEMQEVMVPDQNWTTFLGKLGLS